MTEFPTPGHLTLGELVELLGEYPPHHPVPVGFADPDSYRGYYEDVAFAMVRDTTAGAMLAAAESAVGRVFQGYKGGDYEMGEDTLTWLVTGVGHVGETVGAVLLRLMLGPVPDPGAVTTRDDLRRTAEANGWAASTPTADTDLFGRGRVTVAVDFDSDGNVWGARRSEVSRGSHRPARFTQVDGCRADVQAAACRWLEEATS